MAVVVQSLSCVQLFAFPVDCSPLGSSGHGISQARMLEQVAISFPGCFPHAGIEPAFPALTGSSSPLTHKGRPIMGSS